MKTITKIIAALMLCGMILTSFIIGFAVDFWLGFGLCTFCVCICFISMLVPDFEDEPDDESSPDETEE